MTERAQALEAALRKIRAHTSHTPAAGRGFLAELLASVERIADAALAVQPPPPVGSPTTEPPPIGTNLLGDHLCWACDRACDCCQPDECVSCSRCGESKPQRAQHVATCETNGHVYGHTGACVFCNAPKPVDSIPEE